MLQAAIHDLTYFAIILFWNEYLIEVFVNQLSYRVSANTLNMCLYIKILLRIKRHLMKDDVQIITKNVFYCILK